MKKFRFYEKKTQKNIINSIIFTFKTIFYMIIYLTPDGHYCTTKIHKSNYSNNRNINGKNKLNLVHD